MHTPGLRPASPLQFGALILHWPDKHTDWTDRQILTLAPDRLLTNATSLDEFNQASQASGELNHLTQIAQYNPQQQSVHYEPVNWATDLALDTAYLLTPDGRTLICLGRDAAIATAAEQLSAPNKGITEDKIDALTGRLAQRYKSVWMTAIHSVIEDRAATRPHSGATTLSRTVIARGSPSRHSPAAPRKIPPLDPLFQKLAELAPERLH